MQGVEATVLALGFLVGYGSFPKYEGPNIDPQILQSLLWGPPKWYPDFGIPQMEEAIPCLAVILAAIMKTVVPIGFASLIPH